MSKKLGNRFTIAASIVAAAALFPTTTEAQAICSAPHSSPTLSESASIRTLPSGEGWVQLSTSFTTATESFNPTGDRQDFLGGSTFDTRSAFLTASYGVTRGLEIWGQVPVHRLRTEGGNGGVSRSTGLGDIRTAVRVSPALVGVEAPVALRLGYKQPGSDFPIDATELPLTEGQRDVEVSVESGWAPVESPFYVSGWAGYRWRSENTDTEHQPGDEVFAHLAIGGTLGVLGWELGVDGLWGGTPVDQGLRLSSQDRQLIQIVPTIASFVGPGNLEITAPIPVSGRNLPASYGLSVGYRIGWGR
ncbi:MAG: hypothetical protein U5R14_12005 [Gemmatimonadota bacterium]|nr:hypothetical protein [Gemmatimonadota bacterium]